MEEKKMKMEQRSTPLKGGTKRLANPWRWVVLCHHLNLLKIRLRGFTQKEEELTVEQQNKGV